MMLLQPFQNGCTRGFAIAIAGAYGLLMGFRQGEDRRKTSQKLLDSRPTAVNLKWALDRLSTVSDEDLEKEVLAIHQEDSQINFGFCLKHGAPLLKGGVLTICNTGSLATSGHGTALGMIRTAHKNGQNIHVYALETRPYLQGSRLTALSAKRKESLYSHNRWYGRSLIEKWKDPKCCRRLRSSC